RDKILTRFHEKLLPLLEKGHDLHVISHSWGTVVAYEGLRRYDDEQLDCQVSSFFVLGSALSIKHVRRNLFKRVNDGRKPTVVDRFINLDASGDSVGGSLEQHFEITKEYVDIFPTGCKVNPSNPNTTDDLICAHSSYFNADNFTVNRDIIARSINA
ncbi:MAG: hypothetical protein PVH19_14645, partial [Planctomycetia bacterium]